MKLSSSAKEEGFQLLHVNHAISTNIVALKSINSGVDGLWIVADEQSHGRGRHGRTWFSPKGNFYASLGLISPCPSKFSPLLGFVAGVSLVESLLEVHPSLASDLLLKWPNDCLLEGKKLAGILLEGVCLPNGDMGIAIGIGVNILHIPDDDSIIATSLNDFILKYEEFESVCSTENLFMALSEKIAKNLAIFRKGEGFPIIRETWLRYALPIGSLIKVRMPDGERRGNFAGLNAEGNMLLQSGEILETILAGDTLLDGQNFPQYEEDSAQISCSRRGIL